MSRRRADEKLVSRRMFLAGATVGSVGGIVARDAIAQEFIETGLTLDDLAGEWWLEDIPPSNGTVDPDPLPPVETDPPLGDPVSPPAPNLQVRRDIFSLPEGGREIQSLRRGVAEMRRRSVANPGDPTGWFFQANIHAGGVPQVAACRHGDRFFLSWHRMYLYFFERILRDASGDPGLTLPYWNYSVPGRASLPRPFIVPRDENQNPLYWPRRNEFYNQGGSLPFNIVQVNETLDAGGYDGALGFNALLENAPHNGVHGSIGGSMGFVAEAGRDPIFWLHHCNVDRLWNQWLARGGSRRNPTDIEFVGQRFNFYDERRQLVSMTGQQILDTRSLGYRYDDDRLDPIGSGAVVVAGLDDQPASPFGPGGTQIESLGGADASQAGSTGAAALGSATLAEAPSGVRLGTGGISVPLQIEIPAAREVVETVTSVTAEGLSVVTPIVRQLAPPTVPELFTTPSTQARVAPVVLQLQDIAFERPPGLFNIFVNLPAGTAPDPAGPYYAGYFAPFAQNQTEQPESYDITALLNRQIARGLWDGEEIDVQFIAIGPDGAVTRVVRDPVDIGRIRIIRA